MAVLDEANLKELYTVQKLTDKKIAEMYNVDRTCIVHLRKNYGIPSRRKFNEIVEKVQSRLILEGFEVQNLSRNNGISDIDLIANDFIRIEVMTANMNANNGFRFTLTNKEQCGNIETLNRVRLPNGRFKKQFHLTCDFIIFCGIQNGIIIHWIIPSIDLRKDMQNITMRDTTNSKYSKYQEAWHLIK